MYCMDEKEAGFENLRLRDFSIWNSTALKSSRIFWIDDFVHDRVSQN